MITRRIGAFELGTEISRSEQSILYRATRSADDLPFAIKILSRDCLRDPTIRARYQREIQIIASLEQHAILPVIDFKEQEEQLYIVMPWMTGESLEDKLKYGPIPPDEAIRIIQCLAPALDAVHAVGIVHGDLKPSNILFDQNNQPCITDFGMFKFAEAAAHGDPAIILGPPPYISPEQALKKNELESGSDLYMLAVILFQMLTGQLPYQSEIPLGYAVHHITAPIPNVLFTKPDLPKGFEAVIMRAMAKDPQDRYGSAGEIADALANLERQSLPKFNQIPLPLPDKISSEPITPHIVIQSTPKSIIDDGYKDKPKNKKLQPARIFGILAAFLVFGGVVFLILGRLGYPILSINRPPLNQASITSPSSVLASTMETIASPSELQPTSSAQQVVSTVTKEATTIALVPQAESPTSIPTIAQPVIQFPATQYVYKSGDILFDIAGQHSVNLSEMLSQNGLDCTGRPAAGVTLQIPPSTIFAYPPPPTVMTVANVNQLTLLHTFDCITRVSALAISPDGSILAVASEEVLYLWDIIERKPLRSLKGHISTINSIDFSVDGKYIATGSEDTSIRLWTVVDGSLVKTLYGHKHPVTDIAFSPDGQFLVSTALGDPVSVWKTDGESKQNGTLSVSTAISLAFSSTGDRLAIGLKDALQIYAFPELILVYTFSSADPVSDLAFSPDDLLIASPSDLWHTVEGRHIYHLQNSADAVSFSIDGQVLAIGNKFWHVSNGLSLGELPNPLTIGRQTKGDDYKIALSPDGRLFFWGNKDSLMIWGMPDDYQAGADPGTVSYISQVGDTIFSIANTNSVTLDAFLSINNFTCQNPIFSGQHVLVPDNADTKLVTSEENLPAITEENVQQIDSIRNLAMTCNISASDLIFSTDGQKLISGSAIWNVSTGSILAQNIDIPLRLDGRPETNLRSPLLALSPDQHTLAMRSANNILLWDIDTGHLISVLGSHEGEVSTVAFSPDGKNLVSGSIVGEQAIRLWRVSDGKLLWFKEGSGVQNLTYTHDGKMLLVEGEDSIRFWAIGENKHTSAIRGIDFRMDISNDLNSLAYVYCLQKNNQQCLSEAANIFIFLEGTNLPFTFTGMEGQIQDLQFSPDRTILAGATGSSVTLWGISDGVIIDRLVVPDDPTLIKMVQFSPDGSILISVSEKNTLRFWSMANRTLLYTIDGEKVDRLSFSPDGSMFAILSDGVISLWGVRP
jgi:serine/threonine-protein kinase